MGSPARCILLFILAVGSPTTGQPTLSAVCNSAPAPGQPVIINADCSFPSPIPHLTADARLFYSLDNQNSWQELTMTHIGQPGFDSTWEASLIAPSSGLVRYYIRAADNSGYATQSPFNTDNVWPPGASLLASVAAETSGDASGAEGPWLDLTGAWVGYSADRFYARLRNNHTGWPTYTFPQPYYIYSLGFVNPDAPSDTYVFTMSYASILTIYNTGLYAINRYAGTYERVGDIEANTSGNLLSFRCPVSRFTADPRFGPWPNSTGWLHVAAVTQAVYPIGGSYVRDTTVACRFYADRTPVFTINQNQPPRLSQARIVPDTGDPATPFWFSVRYADDDTNLPLLRAVVVDEDTFELIPSNHFYGNGVTFATTRSGFAPGLHEYVFRFDDGMVVVTTPPDTFMVLGTGFADRSSPPRPRFALTPNPARGVVTLSATPGSPTPVSLALTDVSGRPVGTRTATIGRKLDLRRLSPGVYFVRITAAGTDRTVRLLLLD
uniref:T9SS type A sorting domain-containing protein n=1 Tax=candidate division WOR-3 bacterium TaxID=2052148 RepID=A0A7C4CCS3_UNCW3